MKLYSVTMASAVKKRNFIERKIDWLDHFQQKSLFSFPYAVLKKHGDDEAGYQAALIAYYGFLSIFPLLIVGTGIVQILSQNDPTLREKFLQNATSYFPAIGNTLADSIKTPSKSGLAVFLGLLIALYGTKGVAHAVQHALNHVWSVPRNRRAGFPNSTFKSFGIIAFAGVGFIAAATLIGYTTAAEHELWTRMLLGTGGFIVLFSVFWGVYTFGSSARRHPVVNVYGALFAAVGFLVLQTLGSYIIANQLKSQTGLTAQFAVVLAILFWLYLQAQVFLLGAELASVRFHRLWPRSITPQPPLPADHKAYDLYRHRETFTDDKPVGH